MALWPLMSISVLSNSTSVPTVCFSRRDDRLSITSLSLRIDSSLMISLSCAVNIYILRIPYNELCMRLLSAEARLILRSMATGVRGLSEGIMLAGKGSSI